jgi:hypothetical protein
MLAQWLRTTAKRPFASIASLVGQPYAVHLEIRYNWRSGYERTRRDLSRMRLLSLVRLVLLISKVDDMVADTSDFFW